MRSILEKAFVALLNEEHDKAEELFHKFIVERARQIHESNRAGEDFVLDENWEEEITTESYFTEEDLSDLEDGEGDDAGEEAGDENPFADADEAADDFGADEDGMEAAGDDLAADLGADDAAGDDFGADFDAVEGEEEASIESLEDKIDELTAKFEAMMDAIGADEGEDFDADAEEVDADADADADFDADGGDFEAEVDADAVEDDMDGASEEETEEENEDTFESEESDDEFDDITESIIDELEKVQVSLVDGKEIAAGGSITQNRTSMIPQKSKEARQGGEPVKQKVTPHKHFNRETAPTVADMKPRRNTLKKADSTQSKVSKEGDASAEINKIDSNGNNKSLTPGGKPGFKSK